VHAAAALLTLGGCPNNGMPCSGFLGDYERSLPTCVDNLLL
jgi:hypothetical protein